MASRHFLKGLIKLSTREPWSDRFEQILEDHLILACDETGLEIDDVVSTIGEDLFMSTVWACAFEDFLTREFDDGENAIDDYLKRRGWKESAAVVTYMAALRNSTMSLYEVSDLVPGASFRARDLIRGGEPVLISERSALQVYPGFHSTGATSWSWVAEGKPAPARSGAGESSTKSLTFESWLDDGALVLGDIRLEDQSLVLRVNSRQRSDRGCALLSEVLGPRVGAPSVKMESVEQMMASRGVAAPDQLDIPEQEQCAIIHRSMDRHYRDVLDQPVAMLGGKTPRAAVKTKSGRTKVVDWLKMIENQSAKSADPSSPMANYDFGWLWAELGISELRR
ncbi:hypothetical protein RPD_0063 [Rhodopseudomonas palustris BisB5]|uniref:Antitoxin Xre/MbcA/ParS-like toxin-binding domain-containing protein n=1 Tax=Rhodopseudomonas palustris (strain BisB5) TaxID=316057 RepID=Q13F36_RHOPS|nr:hypothetical protein RPD_0063 [Rhodopseudomonas palustris BisB5]